MKTIGLLGGMSWTSTMEYYRVINELVLERMGEAHSAKVVIWSVDFQQYLDELDSHGWAGVLEDVVEVCENLERAGANFGLFGVNTVHIVFDEVRKRIGLPLLHIADATGAAIAKTGMKRIGLIGTRYTMGEDFYKVRLKENYGIETIIPEEDDFKAIDEIIFDQLVVDIYEKASRQRVIEAIGRLVEAGAEGIVLGCTELPKLLEGADLPVPAFDTLRLHASAAVDLALSEGG